MSMSVRWSIWRHGVATLVVAPVGERDRREDAGKESGRRLCH